MPLSDHEQRLLEQIERALYAEDPKFADAVRLTDLRTHTRRRLQRAALLFLVGLGLLLAGVFQRGGLAAGLGVAGFVVMLLAVFYGLSAVRRTPARVQAAGRGSAGKSRGRRAGVLNRVEERWKRRWEDRGRS